MDIQKLSNEIATLKRAVKDAATAPLKEKLRKKIALLDQNIKDANIPAKKLAMMLLGAKRKVAAYTQAEFNAVIKRLSYKAEYSFLKGLTKPEIKDDLERYAKNPGWRFKGRGNYKTPTKKDLAADAGLPYGKRRTYYEKRSNRSDVTNPAKLKDGGNIKMNEVGFNIQELTKSLSSNEKNQLIKLSNNVVEKAKKKGFSLYVNLREFKKGAEIEIVIKHNHRNIEGKPEYNFMNEFEYKIERGVRITDDLTFDVTTGSYEDSWDENTISIDKYFSIIENAKLKEGGKRKKYEIVDSNSNENSLNNIFDAIKLVNSKGLDLTIINNSGHYSGSYDYVNSVYVYSSMNFSHLVRRFNDVLHSNNIYYIHIQEVFGEDKKETGGGVENENKEMVLNNTQQIEHHAEELENAAKNSKHVPAWVVAKIYNASSDISDATHYLEGVNTMPKEQFERIHEEVENHKMETGGGLDSFLGKQMHVSKVCKTHGCSTKDYFNAKNKYKTGGIIDINELNMPVIRTQFEDEEYEFKDGGGVEVINKMPEGYKKISYDDVKYLKKGQNISFVLYGNDEIEYNNEIFQTKHLKITGKIIRVNDNSDNKYKWTIRIKNSEGEATYFVKDIYTKTGKMKTGGAVGEWRKGQTIGYKTKKEAIYRISLIKNDNESVTEYRNLKVEKIPNTDRFNDKYVVSFEFLKKYKNGGGVGDNQLNIVFSRQDVFEKAKDFYENESAFYPSDVNDEFRTFVFDIENGEADVTEYYMEQELQETHLDGYYFEIADKMVRGGGVDKKKKTDFTISEYIQLEKQKLREHNTEAHEDDRLDWADWKSELTKEDTKEYGIYYNSRMLDSNGDRGVFEYLPINKNYSKDDYAKGGPTKAQQKVGKVMHEFKEGTLHSGKNGNIVKNPKQAIAIALSEAGLTKSKGWKHKK